MAAVAAAATAPDDYALMDDGTIDVAWLSRKLSKAVESVTVREQSKMGGMSCDFQFLDVKFFSEEDPVAMVAKSAPAGKATAVAMGLAREALFYKELAPCLSDLARLPKCFYAAGDMATGQMLLLLECCDDAVPTGLFFGPGNPNNWSQKGQLVEIAEGNPSGEEVAAGAFRLYARMHAAFWEDRELLFSKPWLRASDWLRGEGRAWWQGAQGFAQGKWREILACVEAAGESAFAAEDPALVNGVRWDRHLVACLKSSFGRACSEGGWERYLAEAAARPVTLVHGDAHPHNHLWAKQGTPEAFSVLIDFEMVGCGSPAQDLGQYAISHLSPAARRACERGLVDAYHAELVAALEKGSPSTSSSKSSSSRRRRSITREEVWAEYVAGGAGRWAWFIPVLGSGAAAQYFHDQLAAFLRDHVPDPEAAPMPRV